MEPVAKKKIRMMKTTRQQFEIYLNELQQNIHFRENKFTADQPDVLKKSWEKLTTKLNSSGGPTKDVAGWKKTFADWKSQVRKRARILKTSLKETGNNGAPEKPLSDLESRLLHLTGEVVVEGLTGVPEVGIAEDGVLLMQSTSEEVPIVNRTGEEIKMNTGKTKKTINSTIQKFSEVREEENLELKEINANLEKIITQNERIIWLMEKNMELKYNITFEEDKENGDKENEENDDNSL